MSFRLLGLKFKEKAQRGSPFSNERSDPRWAFMSLLKLLREGEHCIVHFFVQFNFVNYYRHLRLSVDFLFY